MKTVYVIPYGFESSFDYIWGWLRTAGCTPSWGQPHKRADGWMCNTIEVPDGELEQVCMLAKNMPARYGNESEIRRYAAGDLELKPVQS